MPRAKIAISLDAATVARLDRLVEEKFYPNRSQAIEEAVSEKLERLERSRLARECAKLDPLVEKELAEAGVSRDLPEWPNTERGYSLGGPESNSGGGEQSGNRPVVVLSQDVFNARSGTVIAAALTSVPQRAGFPLTLRAHWSLSATPQS